MHLIHSTVRQINLQDVLSRGLHRIGYNNNKSKNASYYFKCYTKGNPVCSKQHNLIIVILSATKHLVQTYICDVYMWTQAC